MLRLARQLATALALSASLLASPMVLAIDEDTRALAQNQRAVEQLGQLGDQVRALLRPEIGFPAEYVAPWQAAVDEAFARDLLEADFLDAFEERLTEETREAALAFDESPLAEQGRRLIEAAEANRDNDESVEAAREAAEAASPEQNAKFVRLFEAQHGPKKANEVMDVYFRMMKIGAEPIIGADAADDWIASAGDLRTAYVENYFFSSAATFMSLEEQDLDALVAALEEPALVDYADQAALAFSDALHAAADRLAIAYPEAIAAR